MYFFFFFWCWTCSVFVWTCFYMIRFIIADIKKGKCILIEGCNDNFWRNSLTLLIPSQLTFTCSKLTLERNTRRRCEICSKLTKKTPEQRPWRWSDIFIVNFIVNFKMSYCPVYTYILDNSSFYISIHI